METTSALDPSLSPEAARPWVVSWERVQEHYAGARQERSAAVAELVTRAVARHATRCAVPVVLELGAGTGGLARRIARRAPGARVVALEADPVLLALARAADGGEGVEVRQGLAGAAGWLDAVGHVDVVVASAVLHYPPASELARLYRQLAAALPARGLLVNADQLPRSPLDTADPTPGVAGGDPWGEWWRTAAAAPELAAAFTARAAAREAGELPVGGDNGLSAAEHRRVLADVGFRETGEVWRRGPSAVLAAWR